MSKHALSYKLSVNDVKAYKLTEVDEECGSHTFGAYFVNFYVCLWGAENASDSIAAFIEICPSGAAPDDWNIDVEIRISCVKRHPVNGDGSSKLIHDKGTFRQGFSTHGAYEFALVGPGNVSNSHLLFKVIIKGDFGCLKSLHFPSHLQSLVACLWEERKFADMVVATDDGEEISCHRSVLSSASSVIDRMLSSDMQEGKKARLELKHVNAKSVKAFLKYLYVGSLDDDEDHIELFKLADMYGIPRLLDVCMQSLEGSFCESNAVDVLRFLRIQRTTSPQANLCYTRLLDKVRRDGVLMGIVTKHILVHEDSEVARVKLFDKIFQDQSLISTVVTPIFDSIIDHI
eukprot:TRINITY_DN24888_c0_g1_i1.p1 TRINITY_DN24888_c0_g1~~TRINITY_DN24888_c0_g1_i1.p1  ORF type:complete len:345 (+),score=41.51 TRINITY_DN24888_c0_g1_i1:97-1131(+)